MKLAAYFVAVLALISIDITNVKKPFDDRKERFDLFHDWWVYQWDDILKIASFAAFGFFLEAIVINYLVKYLFSVDLSDYIFTDITATFLLCLLCGYIGYRKG